MIYFCQFYCFWEHLLFYWMLVIYMLCWLCKSFFFWNRSSDGFLHQIRFCFIIFVHHVSITFFENRVISRDQCFFVIIKVPTSFLNFSLVLSYLLGNGPLILYEMISVLDLPQPVNSRISSIFWYCCQKLRPLLKEVSNYIPKIPHPKDETDWGMY